MYIVSTKRKHVRLVRFPMNAGATTRSSLTIENAAQTVDVYSIGFPTIVRCVNSLIVLGKTYSDIPIIYRYG